MIFTAKDLSPDQKLAIESLLGRSISESEQIVVSTVTPPPAPEWLRKPWRDAEELGTDQLSMDEIDAEIAAAGRSRGGDTRDRITTPRGVYSARLDEKGRMKFPAAFQEYFESLPDKTLFITSLDRRIARIYAMSLWRRNEEMFANYRGQYPEEAQAIVFNAAELGQESEMDGQGRILFSVELRQALGIENSSVRLHAQNGHIEVCSEAIYEERKQRALKSVKALEHLEMEGLI